jgi:beta-fructofuranosidase
MTLSQENTTETSGAQVMLAEQLAHVASHPLVQHYRAARYRLAADPYRPLYHFSPPENFMNDPNGLCQWQGLYHMFYQFRPEGADDRVHWGHTVSHDLIHWHDLPIALYPDQENDCYSGQTLVEADRVIAMYHGTQAGNAIATASDPLLVEWQKHPQNPVIPIVPIDERGAPYRIFDPCIWKEDDGYYALSGTFKDGTRGIDCVGVDYLFRSTDLTHWEFLGELIESRFYTEPGEDMAVPNFWPITDRKHMLLFFSHKCASQYFVGDYDRVTHRFTPTSHGRMNFGPLAVGSLHAPSAMVDDQGRFIAIFSVKEGKTHQGWNDVMTLPRHLELNEDETLRIVPVPATDTLRFAHQRVEATTIPANQEVVLEGVGGKAIELNVVIDPQDARETGLCVLRSPDGVEQTRISFYQQNHRRFGRSSLQIDVSASSTRSDVFARTPETGPLVLQPGELLTLRIYIDRSIIEVYANDRQCLTVRVYPERDDSRGISLFARGSSAQLLSMDVWQMRSIWPELADKEGQ